MIPTANYFGKVIDCRRLSLAGYFFCMKEGQLLELCRDTYSFVNDHFGNECILSWKTIQNNRAKKVIDIDSLLPAVHRGQGLFMLDCHGDVRSNSVYNKVSLKRYDHDLIYHNGFSPSGLASADYSQYAEKEIDPYRESPTMLREALIKVFSLEGRVNQNINRRHDIVCNICSHAMASLPEYDEGEMSIDISMLSLDTLTDEMGEELYRFAMQMSAKYTNINLTVEVYQCYEHEYNSFFGTLIPSYLISQKATKLGRITHEENERSINLLDYSKYMYYGRIGWANILSPQVKRLLPEDQKEKSSLFATQCLSNGALCAKLNMPVHETTISALKELKEYLYPALYPGLSCWKRNTVGRHFWQNVPVLDSEIEIAGGNVIISYQGECNEDYLLQGPTLAKLI